MNIQQTGRNSFAAMQQDLYDYRNLLKTENRLVTLKMEKPRRKGANATDYKIKCVKEDQVWYGFPKKINEDGTVVFNLLSFQGVKQFNLNNLDEAYEFLIWTKSPFFKGSQAQLRTGSFRNLLVEYDPEDEAIKTIKKRALAKSMEDIIENWTAEQRADFATLWKINPKLNSPNMIHSMLLNKLANDPTEFKNFEENYERSTQYLIEIRKAQFADIIKFEHGKGLNYGTIFLGPTEEAAADRLRKDSNLFLTLKSHIEESLKTSNVVSISTKGSNFKKEQERKAVFSDPVDIDKKIANAVDDALAKFTNQLNQNYNLVPKEAPPVVSQGNIDNDDDEDRLRNIEEDLSGFGEKGETLVAEKPKTKSGKQKTEKAGIE